MRYRFEEDFDKERYASQVEDIKRYSKKIAHLMRLQDWRITVWFDTQKEIGKDDHKDLPVQADTVAEAQYKTAAVRFYVKSMTTKSTPAELRGTVIHEFCHVLLSPYSGAALQVCPKSAENLLDWAEEMVVTHLESLPVWDSVE